MVARWARKGAKAQKPSFPSTLSLSWFCTHLLLHPFTLPPSCLSIVPLHSFTLVPSCPFALCPFTIKPLSPFTLAPFHWCALSPLCPHTLFPLYPCVLSPSFLCTLWLLLSHAILPLCLHALPLYWACEPFASSLYALHNIHLGMNTWRVEVSPSHLTWRVQRVWRAWKMQKDTTGAKGMKGAKAQKLGFGVPTTAECKNDHRWGVLTTSKWNQHSQNREWHFLKIMEQKAETNH